MSPITISAARGISLPGGGNGAATKSRSMTNRQPLYVLALGAFAVGTDAFVIGGILPAVAAGTGVTVGAAGLLVTAFALSYAIGAPLLSAAVGRLDRRAVLATALAIFSATNLLAALAPNFGVLMLSRIAAALAAGTFMPTASAAAASLVTPEYRGRALALVLGGMTTSMVAGVPLGTLIGNALGWRATFAMVATIGALAAVGTRAALPRVPAPPAATVRTRLRLARRSTTWPLLLQTALSMAAGFAVLTYIAPVMSQAAGVRGEMLSLVLVLFGVASLAGTTIGGRLTDRIGDLRVAVGGLLALTASLLGLAAAAATALGWPALILVVAWGAAGWIFLPAQQHRLVGLAPDQATVLLGLNSSAIYLGAALGGALGGAILRSGADLVVLGGASLAGLALLAALLQLAGIHRSPPTRPDPPAPSTETVTSGYRPARSGSSKGSSGACSSAGPTRIPASRSPNRHGGARKTLLPPVARSASPGVRQPTACSRAPVLQP